MGNCKKNKQEFFYLFGINIRIILFFVLFAVGSVSSAQSGKSDSSFNVGDWGFGHPGGTHLSGLIYSCFRQNNGKILIAGDFSSFNQAKRIRIARLNPDGTLDTTFNPGNGADATVFTITAQEDGKVLIGGMFSNVDGFSRKSIARLNMNGTVDDSFVSNITPYSYVNSIAIQPDGKIIIAGIFSTYNGVTRNGIARILANGQIDNGFDPGTGTTEMIKSVALQTDGKILISGFFTSFNGVTKIRAARLNPNGSLDNSFDPGTGTNAGIEKIKQLQDGKIITVGNFSIFNGISRYGVAMLHADGRLDTSFNPGTGAAAVNTVAQRADGKIFIAGNFSTYNSVAQNQVALLNLNGSLDTSFKTGTGFKTVSVNGIPYDITLLPNQKLLVTGNFYKYNSVAINRYNIALLDTNGSNDIGFCTPLGADRKIWAIAVQADKKIIIGGQFTYYNGVTRNYLARLHPDGAIDSSFNNGTGITGTYISSFALQQDQKILVAGVFSSYNGTSQNNITRLNQDGSIDTGFHTGSGTNSQVAAMAIQPDGKIIIAGTFTTFNGISKSRIARLNADGTIDASFNPGAGANSGIKCLALQTDGKVLIGGGFSSFNGVAVTGVLRLNTDGTIDTGFSPAAVVNRTVNAIALSSQGKILIGGTLSVTSFVQQFNTDGSIDNCFNPGSGPNTNVEAILVRPDGKILVGGGFGSFNGIARVRIAQLLADGSVDTTFDPGAGAAKAGGASVVAFALQTDNKVLVGGDFTSYDALGRNYICRVFLAGPTAYTNCFIYSIASGSWNNPAIWDKARIPGTCDSVIIRSGHTVDLANTVSIKNLSVHPGGNLLIANSSAVLQIGGVNQEYGSVLLFGGLTISAGEMKIYGRLQAFSYSDFKMNGGALKIDGNTGAVFTSVPNGMHLFHISPCMTGFEFTGGLLQLVNPPLGINSQAISCSYDFGDNSTLQLGDGLSEKISLNPNGFGGSLFPSRIGKFILDVKTITGNRHFINLNPLSIKSPVYLNSGNFIQSALLSIRN